MAKVKPPNLRESEVWKSIFRPGSIYRKGYKDTSRDRALATMNNDRTAGGSKSTVQTVVAETELPAGEFVVSGSQTLTLEVIK